jgi:hypothetical protein
MMAGSMLGRSGTTNLAIIAGAAIGVTGAVFAGKPKPPRPEPIATTPVPVPSSTESSTPRAPPAASSQPMESADAVAPVAVRAAELDCARGVTKMCLIAASADAGQSRVFANLAVSQWSAACTGRDAEACHELANLHERGIGVPASAEQAKALRQRARDLCGEKRSAFCDSLRRETP